MADTGRRTFGVATWKFYFPVFFSLKDLKALDERPGRVRQWLNEQRLTERLERRFWSLITKEVLATESSLAREERIDLLVRMWRLMPPEFLRKLAKRHKVEECRPDIIATLLIRMAELEQEEDVLFARRVEAEFLPLDRDYVRYADYILQIPTVTSTTYLKTMSDEAKLQLVLDYCTARKTLPAILVRDAAMMSPEWAAELFRRSGDCSTFAKAALKLIWVECLNHHDSLELMPLARAFAQEYWPKNALSPDWWSLRQIYSELPGSTKVGLVSFFGQSELEIHKQVNMILGLTLSGELDFRLAYTFMRRYPAGLLAIVRPEHKMLLDMLQRGCEPPDMGRVEMLAYAILIDSCTMTETEVEPQCWLLLWLRRERVLDVETARRVLWKVSDICTDEMPRLERYQFLRFMQEAVADEAKTQEIMLQASSAAYGDPEKGRPSNGAELFRRSIQRGLVEWFYQWQSDKS